MSETNELWFEERGTDFLLVQVGPAGQRTEMALSEENLMTLAQSAQGLRDRIFARRSRSGERGAPMTPVIQIRINTDVHQSELHLEMISPGGADSGFTLSLPIAKALAGRLPVRIREIEAAKPVRQ